MARETREDLVASVRDEVRALHVAADQVEATIAELIDLNRSDARALDMLLLHGPMTAGALAEATGLSTGAITSVVDRLQSAGYAERQRDRADRRRVLVVPTETAARTVGDVRAEIAAAGATTLRRATKEQLRVIRDFLRSERELNRDQAARLQRRLAHNGPLDPTGGHETSPGDGAQAQDAERDEEADSGPAA